MIYDNDPRVAQRGNGWSVTDDDGREFRVLYTTVFNWSIYHGRDLELVDTGHVNAEAAIRSLIGDPKVAAS